MTLCVTCGREEVNNRCKYCEARVVKESYKTAGYESYMQTAAKVRREYGEHQYQIFIIEYEKYKEAKKEGREAYEGYVSNVLFDLSAILKAKARNYKVGGRVA